MLGSLLCSVMFEICPMYIYIGTIQKTTTYLLHQNLGKISVDICSNSQDFRIEI